MRGPMAEEIQAPPPAAEVKLDSIVLQRVQLDRLGSWPDGEEDLDFDIRWGVGGVYLPGDRVGVEVAVRVVHADVVDLEVAYRLELSRSEGRAESSGAEQFWQAAVARLAPVIAVPYIRETVHSITGKAIGEGVMLPVANYGDYFSPEQIPLVALGETEEK